MSQIKSFLHDPASLFNIKLLRFLPPREAAEAKIKVKQCVDQMPSEDRKKIYDVLVNCFSFSQGLLLSCSARRDVRVLNCGH